MVINMKRDFINYCGLLGIVAFLSYTAALVFSPLAYPGYSWMAQAVSDLSAANAPSLRLWNQLSSLYNICTLICAMMVCAGIQGKGSKIITKRNLSVYHNGMDIVPKEYFGVVERFSVFAAVGYNAVLGVELFRMDLG